MTVQKLTKIYGNGNHITINYDGKTYAGVMFGNDECYQMNEFYQLFLDTADHKLYQVYYDIPDYDDASQALDMIDYNHPYDMVLCDNNFTEE